MFSGFMFNTWIVGSLVALVAGIAGFFVVMRGATFAAHALPLGTFPGAAAAGLVGINAIWGLIAFAGLGVVGIFQLSTRQRHDVATALTLIFLLGPRYVVPQPVRPICRRRLCNCCLARCLASQVLKSRQRPPSPSLSSP